MIGVLDGVDNLSSQCAVLPIKRISSKAQKLAIWRVSDRGTAMSIEKTAVEPLVETVFT